MSVPNGFDRRAALGELFYGVLKQTKLLVAIVILGLLNAAVSLLQPVIVGRVIDTVSDGASLGELPLVLVALIGGGAMVGGLLQYVIQRVAETSVCTSRRRLISHILRLPMNQIDRMRAGDLVARVSNDTMSIRDLLSHGMIESILGMFVLVGAFVSMLLIDPVLVLVTSVAAIIAVAVVVLSTQAIERSSVELQNETGQLSADVDRAVRAMRTIRVANAVSYEQEHIEKQCDNVWSKGLKVAKNVALVSPLSSVATHLSLLITFGVGGLRVATGALSVAQLVTFVLFALLFISPLGQIMATISSLGEALGGATRIVQIMELPEEDVSGLGSMGLGKGQPSDALLEFRGVSFGYLSQDSLCEGDFAISDVTFSVRPGETLAIVGPSGAGKSTVLDLISRLYDPVGGTIFFKGADVASLDRRIVRNHIAYVEQDAPILSGTIRDNLTLGISQVDDAKLMCMLQAFNLIDVCNGSHDGLDADVGEHGVLLSGGERQRLALLRALLREPELLLLDESTSNLDGANEELAQNLIDHYTPHSARIIVAHRLSTVVDADDILVLDGGRVVDEGTHVQLLQTSPLYRNLAHTQLLSQPA